MTVQAQGRCGQQRGYMRWGVSESGGLDSTAAAQGSLLCNNHLSDAYLEFFHYGGEFEYHGDERAFALVGGDFKARLNGKALQWGGCYVLSDGDRLDIGAAIFGQVGTLHIQGGIAVAPVLSSRATHVRAGLGGFEGRLLRDRDILPVAEISSLSAYIGYGFAALRHYPKEIRVLSGSGAHLYSAAMRQRFYHSEFGKTSQSDRLGAILDYSGAAFQAQEGLTVISDAIVLGDIQIQGGGTMAVLLADRQTTGGYPRIATIISADLPHFVQLPPRQPFQFHHVDYDTARAAMQDYWRQLAQLSPDKWGDDKIIASADLLQHNLISGVSNADD